MDANAKGYGFVVAMPRFLFSHLGNVVYIDQGGVVRDVGSIFGDDYFKCLASQSTFHLDRTTTEESHPSTLVAFTTGCIDIKPLVDSELSA